MATFSYTVICKDRGIVMEMAQYDTCRVIEQDAARNLYLFIGNEPTVGRWKSWGCTYHLGELTRKNKVEVNTMIATAKQMGMWRYSP